MASFDNWVPAVTAAAVGISAFGYAWVATRRFDRANSPQQPATQKLSKAVKLAQGTVPAKTSVAQSSTGSRTMTATTGGGPPVKGR